MQEQVQDQRSFTGGYEVVVVCGGDDAGIARLPSPDEMAPGAVVIAADSGLGHALSGGLRVDHLVGDLDSADPSAVRAAEAAGTTVHRHEADKDATDIELALDLASDLLALRPDCTGGAAAGMRSGARPARVLVVGPGGGRLDHLLADLFAIGGTPLADQEVVARFGPATVLVVRAGRTAIVPAELGAHVSLLAVHGPVGGVNTAGLRWPLVDAHLAAGSTRGVSNEVVHEPATVAVGSGTLLVVVAGTAAGSVQPRRGDYDPTPRPAET